MGHSAIGISAGCSVQTKLLPETIGWVLTVAFLCLTSVGSHWFGKNTVAMATGTWSLLNASWKVIVPLTPRSQRFVIAVSAWAGLLTQIQDLRDIKGDAAVGRKTTPLVFGERATRWIITLLLLPASFWVLWIGDIVPIAPKTLTAVHLFLGYRVLKARGSRYDHKTYMVSPLYSASFSDQSKHEQIYTYVFCLILMFTAVDNAERDLTKTLSALGMQMME